MQSGLPYKHYYYCKEVLLHNFNKKIYITSNLVGGEEIGQQIIKYISFYGTKWLHWVVMTMFCTNTENWSMCVEYAVGIFDPVMLWTCTHLPIEQKVHLGLCHSLMVTSSVIPGAHGSPCLGIHAVGEMSPFIDPVLPFIW